MALPELMHVLAVSAFATYGGDAVDGLVTGAVFALLALGVVTIHRTTGTLNLAQGGLATLAALAWIGLRSAGVPGMLALLLVVAGGLVAGAVIGLAVGWPLRGAAPVTKLVSSLGLLLLVQGVVALTFGQADRLAPPLVSSGSLSVGGIRVGIDGLVVLGSAVVAALALEQLFDRTRVGLHMRAVAADPVAAALQGVGVRRVVTVAWAAGVGLAALGGVLLGPAIVVVGPFLLTAVALQAFGATLLGRIASLRGALLGGLVIGQLVTFLGLLLPSLQGSTDIAVFAFIVAAVALGGRPRSLGART